MCNEFVKFQDYLKRLRGIYLSALSSFYVFDTLTDLMAPNIVGEDKVKNNLNILNRFNGFFDPARRAVHFHFLMELAKLFDDAKQSLHLEKLINFSQSNNKHLSAENFKNANQDREFIDELVERYEGINKADFSEIKKLLDENEVIIKKLKDHRDQCLAHEDINKKKIHITLEEIQILLSIIEKILNTFSYKTDFSTTEFDLLKSDCKEHTEGVIDYLKRFNSLLLEERRILEERREKYT